MKGRSAMRDDWLDAAVRVLGRSLVSLGDDPVGTCRSYVM